MRPILFGAYCCHKVIADPARLTIKITQPMNGSQTTNGQSDALQDEAGATDNQLQLDPNDPRWKSAVGNWEDGKTYEFSSLKVRQISPGVFEVTDAVPGAESEGTQEDTTDASESAEPSEPSDSGYQNPAVAGMMR